jgi:pimeloyl-ACP methyl ester carboxylesterase
VARRPEPASSIEVPGPWQHAYIAANGARFHVVEAETPVQVAGDSTPQAEPPLILLLHGFPEFWWSWRAQLPALAAEGYRAVAMDLRGYGGSDKPPRGYDPVTLAGDVAGVVKALGERHAIVVGHGWGGYVGWAAAALHPREVAGLCAVSVPHPLVMLPLLRSPGRARALAHVLAMQVPLVPERRLSHHSSTFMRDHLTGWSGRGPAGFPDEEAVRRYQEAMQLWPAPHCALEYHRWLVRSRFRADGRRFRALMEPPVTVPVCSVHGAEDRAVPARGSELSARQVDGPFEAHVLPGIGHFPPEESPEEMNRVLLGWLAGLRR